MRLPSTLASQFTQRLQGLSREYDAAQVALERMQTATASLADDPHAVVELETLVAGLRRQATECADIRRDWEQCGGPQSPELQQQLQLQTSRLERLLLHVQHCEQQFQVAREQLRPRLDQGARRTEMQRAYGEHRVSRSRSGGGVPDEQSKPR